MNTLIFALILSISHLFGQRVDLRQKWLFNSIRSFSAGISIAYIFTVLLPELLIDSRPDSVSALMLPVVFGVTISHVVIRTVMNVSEGRKEKILTERLHLSILLFANFVTSYLALRIVSEDTNAGLLLIIILSIHYLLMDLVAHNISIAEGYENRVWEVALVLSPIVAALLLLSGIAAPVTSQLIMGAAIGMMFYMTLHEEIPQEKDGKPILFALGVIFLILIGFGTL